MPALQCLPIINMSYSYFCASHEGV